MTTPKRPDQLDSPLLPVIFRYATRTQVWIYRRTGGKVGGKWRIGAGFRKQAGAHPAARTPGPQVRKGYADFDTDQSWTDREIPAIIPSPR